MSMTGWLIKVSTERMGGGVPMDDLYAVGEPDAATAVGLVEKSLSLTADQIPETVAQLSSASLRGLGVEVGQVAHVVTEA